MAITHDELVAFHAFVQSHPYADVGGVASHLRALLDTDDPVLWAHLENLLACLLGVPRNQAWAKVDAWCTSIENVLEHVGFSFPEPLAPTTYAPLHAVPHVMSG